MQFLARLVMRGRWQAAAVAAALSMTPLFFIAGAVIALLTMRRGVREGLIVLLWSSLPSALMLYMDGDPLPVTVMLGCWLAAWILRSSGSWPFMLLGGTLLGLGTGVAAPLVAGAHLAEAAEAVNALQAWLAKSMPPGAADAALANPFTGPDIANVLGAATAYLVLAGAVLGRYWQAALFNPGGFRREFHALRLPLAVTLAVTAGALWSMQLENERVMQTQLWLFMMPLLLAGLARAHAAVAERPYGSGWLAALYILALLFPLARFALAGVGMADSVLSFVKNRRDKE